MTKQRLLKMKENNKKYREKVLNKTKKFFSARLDNDDAGEIKNFMKEHNISIREIIEIGTEIMWGETN